MEYEELLSKVGAFGRYQWILISMVCILFVSDCFIFMGYVFITALPDHWCRLPDTGGNITLEEMKAAFLPIEVKDGIASYSHCQMYNRSLEEVYSMNGSSFFGNHSGGVISCQNGWDYDRGTYKSSVSMEFDMVCERRPLVATSQSVFMAGLMVGIMVSGILSDRFGRKRVASLAMIVYIAAPFVLAFSTNFYMFLVVRFLMGLCTLATTISFLVLAMEIIDAKKRVLVISGGCYFWAAGFSVVAGLAYLCREWRHLQLVMSCIPLLFTGVVLMSTESPRWLYTKGRTEEAHKAMAWIARWNRTEMPDDCKVIVKDEDTSVYIWEVLKYRRLRIWSAIIFFEMFVCSLVYYGLSLSSTEIIDNDYLGFMLSGAIEIPTYAFCHLTLDYFGRRKMSAFALSMGGIAMLCTMAVPVHLSRSWIMVLLTSIGKAAVTASFVFVGTHTTEVFPTVVRNSGYATGSFFARVGGIVAPQMALLAEFSRFIPLVTFGVLSLAAGIAALFLPETAGNPLPETFEDSERMAKRKPRVGNVEEMKTMNAAGDGDETDA